MSALLLRQISILLVPLAMLFGLSLYMKGHDQPGGGFVAGLSWAIAAVLAIAAFGPRSFRAWLRPGAETLLLLGGLLVSFAVVVPAFFGEPLLKHGSVKFSVPLLGENKLHSALIFDLGVLLVVAGGVAAIASILAGHASTPDSARDETPDSARDESSDGEED